MTVIIDVLKNISLVGNSAIIEIIGLAALAFFFIRKDILRVEMIVLCFFSGIYSTVLKGIFMASRPSTYVPTGFIPWDTFLVWGRYSFPSTHTVLYTVLFGYLFYLTYKVKDVDKVLRHMVRILSAIMVLTVGASRVVVGAHFAKDVAVGYIFGFIYLFALIKLERFLEQRQLSRLPEHKKQ